MADIKAVDQRRETLRHRLRGRRVKELAQVEHQVRMQPAGIDLQQAAGVFRLQGAHIKSQPGGDDLALELALLETRIDDRIDPLPRTFCGFQPLGDRKPESLQYMAHGGEKDLILGSKVMMRQGRRHSCTFCNLAHSNVERSGLSNLGNRCRNQSLSAQDRHAFAGHIFHRYQKLGLHLLIFCF